MAVRCPFFALQFPWERPGFGVCQNRANASHACLVLSLLLTFIQREPFLALVILVGVTGDAPLTAASLGATGKQCSVARGTPGTACAVREGQVPNPNSCREARRGCCCFPPDSEQGPPPRSSAWPPRVASSNHDLSRWWFSLLRTRPGFRKVPAWPSQPGVNQSHPDRVGNELVLGCAPSARTLTLCGVHGPGASVSQELCVFGGARGSPSAAPTSCCQAARAFRCPAPGGHHH